MCLLIYLKRSLWQARFRRLSFTSHAWLIPYVLGESHTRAAQSARNHVMPHSYPNSGPYRNNVNTLLDTISVMHAKHFFAASDWHWARQSKLKWDRCIRVSAETRWRWRFMAMHSSPWHNNPAFSVRLSTVRPILWVLSSFYSSTARLGIERITDNTGTWLWKTRRLAPMRMHRLWKFISIHISTLPPHYIMQTESKQSLTFVFLPLGSYPRSYWLLSESTDLLRKHKKDQIQ